MCGRFVRSSTIHDISGEFNVEDPSVDLLPSFNVAPGQDVAVIINDGSKRLIMCRWGFVPSWANNRSSAYKMINARSETAADKPSFRSAFSNSRGLIVADGFYEWRRKGESKSPVYVHLKSRRPFGMAGLFSRIREPQAGDIYTCTILTTEANTLLSHIHDRMPVIIPREKEDLWLDPGVKERETLQQVMTPYDSKEMVSYNVSSIVNSPAHDSPDNIRSLHVAG